MKINLHDDLFLNPDEVRSIALQQQYHEPIPGMQGWKGFRTHQLNRNDYEFIYTIIEEKINLTFPLYEGKIPYEVECYFHYCVESDSLNDHRDIGYYAAGVVYLHPYPLSNTGTKILNDVVENQYNRMVYYESNQLHGVMNAFGHSLETGRLTLTFFVPYPPFWKLNQA